MRSHGTSGSKEQMYVTWHDVELWTHGIVDHILLSGDAVEAVLAIGAGGIVPAAMISYLYGKRVAPTEMCTIHARSYEGVHRQEVSSDISPADVNKLKLHKEKLLIVDDIADSGANLAHFKSFFKKAQTATLIHKTRSSVEPDFCGHVDKHDDRFWYVMPWERER